MISLHVIRVILVPFLPREEDNLSFKRLFFMCLCYLSQFFGTQLWKLRPSPLIAIPTIMSKFDFEVYRVRFVCILSIFD